MAHAVVSEPKPSMTSCLFTHIITSKEGRVLEGKRARESTIKKSLKHHHRHYHPHSRIDVKGLFLCGSGCGSRLRVCSCGEHLNSSLALRECFVGLHNQPSAYLTNRSVVQGPQDHTTTCMHWVVCHHFVQLIHYNPTQELLAQILSVTSVSVQSSSLLHHDLMHHQKGLPRYCHADVGVPDQASQ